MFLVVTLVPIALAINYLITRYRYSKKNQALLVLLWVLSYLAGIGFMRFHWPDIELAYIYLGALALSLPIFVILGLAAVTYLRQRLLSGFDQEIGRLDRERERVRSALALVEQRLALAASRQRAIEGRHREKLAEQKILQSLLDEWQQSGGVARLRAVKVQEWRDELRGLDRRALETRRADIQRELERLPEGESGDRQDQLRAQLKVIDLALLEPDLAAPNEELSGLEKDVADLTIRKKEDEAKLAELGRELEEWRSRRNEFLSRQITLG